MTDKVEQVLAKIEERLNHLNGLHGDFLNGQQHELILMRNFINSLQKETKFEVGDKIKSKPDHYKFVAPTDGTPKCMYSMDSYTEEDRKFLCDGCEENCKYNLKQKPDELTYSVTKISNQEEPVSEELEKVALEYATHYDKNWSEVKDGYIAENEVEAFKAGANWKREQIAKENMLLPFKDYDNLMESINKRKKEGYEAGYRQGLVDSKSE